MQFLQNLKVAFLLVTSDGKLQFLGTVGDNVRYGPNLQGKTLSDSAVEGLLSLADLDSSFVKKSIIGLSVGQAQRVALARTLANEPEVRFPLMIDW